MLCEYCSEADKWYNSATKAMETANGTTTYDQQDVRDKLVDYFSNFGGLEAESNDPSMEVILQGNCLSNDQGADILKPLLM